MDTDEFRLGTIPDDDEQFIQQTIGVCPAIKYTCHYVNVYRMSKVFHFGISNKTCLLNLQTDFPSQKIRYQRFRSRQRIVRIAKTHLDNLRLLECLFQLFQQEMVSVGRLSFL